ncbi:MAG: S8 family serine peptidase [Candidatus Hodarchaeota archaeon]
MLQPNWRKPDIHAILQGVLFGFVLLSTPMLQACQSATVISFLGSTPEPVEAKISEPLLRLISTTSDSNQSVNVIAQLFPDAEIQATQRAILQLGVLTRIKTYHAIIHALSLETTVGSLTELAALSEIQKLWSDAQFQLDVSSPSLFRDGQVIPPTGYLHPRESIGVNPLYNQGFNGAHTVVAILSTGIDATHPDLDDMDDNESTTDPKVLAQVSFAEGDPFPFDLNGHGTYCAGLVAGTGAASNGNYTGIAPAAQLISVKVLLSEGQGYSSWIIRGIEWSVTNGADIILIPFSTLGLPGDPLSKAVQAATARGVLVITAAGDSGPNHMTILSPGESIAAMTVGAFDVTQAKVAEFSSRGPTLDMRTKPDIVAPGIGVIASSLHDIIPTEIGNLSIPFSLDDFDVGILSGGIFGTPVNENYTQASTTAASAAITAGAACLLLQGNRFATPEHLSIGIRRGATPYSNEPNEEGAGLLNAFQAYSELATIHNPFPTGFRARSVSPGLPYYGLVMSEGTQENVTLLLSGYATAIAGIVTSQVTNLTMFHMLMGMFSLAVGNNSPTGLAFLDIEQEFHWTGLPFGDYVRATGILSYNDLLIIPRVECWRLNNGPSANAFRFSFFFVNIGAEEVKDICLYSLWNFDLFSGANDTSVQQAFFNDTAQLFHIHRDALPPNETSRVDQFVGVNGTTPFSNFQVGPYEEVTARVQNETLTGATTYSSDEGIGLGTQWQIGNISTGAKALNVSMTLGFGRNMTALTYGINGTNHESVVVPLTDLCMIRVDLPRTGTTTSAYSTSIIALNIGDVGVDSIAAFFTNRSQPQGGAVFARYFQIGIFEPFQFQPLEVEWDPEVTDIYFVGWIVSPMIDFDLFIPIIPSDLYPLDNLVFRDAFICTHPRMRMLIPSILPFSPMTLQFPNDYAIYNFSLISSTPIPHLFVEITEYYNSSLDYAFDRNVTRWENPPTLTPQHIYDISGSTQFQILTLIPTFIEAGPYYGNLVLSASDGWHLTLPFIINITYPKAVVLFDTVHNQGLDFTRLDNLDFSELSLDEILVLFEEIGDSLLTGYSRLRQLFADIQLNLAEIPLVTEINSTILSLFDGLILCDPEKAFTQNETNAISEFINSGFKVLVLADDSTSSNHTTLNQLLFNHSIQLGGGISGENTTELHPTMPFTVNVNVISITGGTTIPQIGPAQPFAWANGTPVGVYNTDVGKELFVLGCSRIFGNDHIYTLDNLRFANQTIRHLFRNTVSISIRPTGGNGSRFTIGRDAGFVIDAYNQTGQGVEDLEMFIIYTFPNGSRFFFIAFEVKEGRYGTFLFANWTGLDTQVNTTQTFTITVFTLPGIYASSTAYMIFYYDPAPDRPLPPPTPNFFAIMMLQIALFSIALTLIIAGYFLNQYRRQRRMRTSSLDEQLLQDIENTMNTTQAIIREIEWVLTDRRIDRLEKLRITSGDPAERLEEMLKRLRELAKETGV